MLGKATQDFRRNGVAGLREALDNMWFTEHTEETEQDHRIPRPCPDMGVTRPSVVPWPASWFPVFP